MASFRSPSEKAIGNDEFFPEMKESHEINNNVLGDSSFRTTKQIAFSGMKSQASALGMSKETPQTRSKRKESSVDKEEEQEFFHKNNELKEELKKNEKKIVIFH